MRHYLLIVVLAIAALQQACAPLIIAGLAGGGALMVTDRRKTGTIIEDQSIELKAQRRLKETLGEEVHIDVTSYNMHVLLTGETPTAALRTKVESIVKEIPTVKKVTNELRIAAPSSLGARGADASISTKVKTRFVSERRFYPNHVKVTTEAGVVYLMGIVSEEEADDAADIASTTAGVQKVVKVFEYREGGRR